MTAATPAGALPARCCALWPGDRELNTRIETAIAPSARQVAQLDEIPSVGATGAQKIIAEIGVGMARFPTPGHLASWAKFAPTPRQSAGKNRPGTTGKGNPWLGGALGEAVIGAARDQRPSSAPATTGPPGAAGSGEPWSRWATPS